MKDKKERFHQELKELLKKYDAELIIDSGTPVYDWWGPGDCMIVEFNITNIEEEPIPALILGNYEDGQDI